MASSSLSFFIYIFLLVYSFFHHLSPSSPLPSLFILSPFPSPFFLPPFSFPPPSFFVPPTFSSSYNNLLPHNPLLLPFAALFPILSSFQPPLFSFIPLLPATLLISTSPYFFLSPFLLSSSLSSFFSNHPPSHPHIEPFSLPPSSLSTSPPLFSSLLPPPSFILLIHILLSPSPPSSHPLSHFLPLSLPHLLCFFPYSLSLLMSSSCPSLSSCAFLPLPTLSSFSPPCPSVSPFVLHSSLLLFSSLFPILHWLSLISFIHPPHFPSLLLLPCPPPSFCLFPHSTSLFSSSCPSLSSFSTPFTCPPLFLLLPSPVLPAFSPSVLPFPLPPTTSNFSFSPPPLLPHPSFIISLSSPSYLPIFESRPFVYASGAQSYLLFTRSKPLSTPSVCPQLFHHSQPHLNLSQPAISLSLSSFRSSSPPPFNPTFQPLPPSPQFLHPNPPPQPTPAKSTYFSFLSLSSQPLLTSPFPLTSLFPPSLNRTESYLPHLPPSILSTPPPPPHPFNPTSPAPPILSTHFNPPPSSHHPISTPPHPFNPPHPPPFFQPPRNPPHSILSHLPPPIFSAYPLLPLSFQPHLSPSHHLISTHFNPPTPHSFQTPSHYQYLNPPDPPTPYNQPYVTRTGHHRQPHEPQEPLGRAQLTPPWFSPDADDRLGRQLLAQDVHDDDDEEQQDAEEVPDVDELDVGRLGERGGRLVEGRVQDEEGRQRHRESHLLRG
ncbi:hypothetical protein C7M84_009992 [Penaeus vannamei]|uniref:Uncharacterized protein n=1 Tax=Penaeus vannamei TaxID=6689 RepID=A0A423T568_PENVA|nr:hypothetical protein C7M84_009992 [Penaeus vannamei]